MARNKCNYIIIAQFRSTKKFYLNFGNLNLNDDNQKTVAQEDDS